MNDHAQHVHSVAHKWTLGIATGLGAIIAAPYLFTALGSETTVGDTMALLHGDGLGTGLAGVINGGISHIPLVGEALVSGGYASLVATAGIGIGGILLANYLEKKEHLHPTDGIKWSKVIRYASLATSMLIALPSILTGLSVGLSFLAITFGGIAFGIKVLGLLSITLGSAGAKGGVSLAAATLPHLFTCGASLLPVFGSVLLSDKAEGKPDRSGLTMKLLSATPIVKDLPCELTFQLLDSTGRVLTPDELAMVHTKKLHTMIVDHSLTDYHHLHPQYDPQRGVFVCHFTPRMTHSYRAWHDITLAKTGAQTFLANELPAVVGVKIPPTVMPSSRVVTEDLQVGILPDAPLRAGKEGMLMIDVRGRMGEALNDLEPLMGAYAHLVGFSQDGKHIIHCHPMGDEPISEADRGQGMLHFHVAPETEGNIKFFLQIKRNGRESTIPFGQTVLSSKEFVARVGQSRHQHATLAVA